MKSVLFKPDMIKAIVEGHKTQTRRAIKDLPQDAWLFDYLPNGAIFDQPSGEILTRKSRYQIGETVYIKEMWATYKKANKIKPKEIPNRYRIWYADIVDLSKYRGKWRSPLFMPAWAARYFIQITDVRVERLQEIDLEGVIAEGINPQIKEHDSSIDLRLKFAWLWDTINKPPYDWSSNPWIWVYEFKLK